MVFHDQVEWVSVGLSMATSFAFWWVAAYVLGGDKYAPAIIGMTITGVRGAIAGKAASGALPDNLGIISAKGYGRGGKPGGGTTEAGVSALMSGVATFIFWLIAGYFVISGSAWKYATTAAVIAVIGSFVSMY